MRPETFPELVRRGFYESCEDRLALTADPIELFSDDMIGGSISHHREVAPTLSEAHESTGLNQVRDTYGFRGGGQTAVIIDSGIAYDHEALGEGFGTSYRVVGGWDFTEENDADPYDDGPAGFHGTHVAGIVGSDDSRHTGVAPDVDLVALRVFNDQGQGYFQWVEQALQWVHEHRNDFENPITTVNLSLGTSWNDDSVPFGAILENEFAQLKADGIFVAVSAGNSFQQFNQEAGLSYPAASPYVVPVASVDGNGNLSDFSQRNERVLAAPGEFINSTVPDYIFGADGVHNDYGAASGTSMAAPYVAGASVLLREAMEFVGYTDINQDTIYDHLWDTADVIHDSITGLDIHRINLSNAFDTLMPADEDAAGAVTLANVGAGINVDGMISRIDDTDTFTFTADVSGAATFDIAPGSTALWQAGSGQTVEGDSLSFQVTAGQSYTVTLAGNGDLCHYQFDAAIASTAIDLGAVDFNSFLDLAVSGEQTYRMTATADGFLSVIANWNNADGSVQVELYNEQQELLSTVDSSNGTLQVDATVAAGEAVFVRVIGTTEVDLLAGNFVAVAGDHVTITGTDAADTVAIEAGATHRVTANGFDYEFAAAEVSLVTVNGGDGTDSVVISGTSGNEVATIRQAAGTVTGSGFEFAVNGFEDVTVNGGGGTDTALLYDTAGDEVFTARSTTAELAGSGFTHRANAFSRVNAYATGGGTDLAVMHDSAGDDVFGGLHDHSFLYGDGYFNYARGFDRVNAYASAGGTDLGTFYDSAGNDTFVGLHDYSAMVGTGFYNYARGFDRVNAYAASGGTDLAILYDSAGDDIFVGLHDYSAMVGTGFYNYARGFDRVNAYATAGGNDKALFYDSAGDDSFVALHDHSAIKGDGFYNYARGFDRVQSYAINGGYDRAQIYDSASNDLFVGTDEYSAMSGGGNYNYARGFDRVDAYAVNGGNDRAIFYGSSGADTFLSTEAYSRQYGFDYYSNAVGFEETEAVGHAAGDRAFFLELGSDDSVTGRDDYLRRDRAEFSVRYQGVGNVLLYSDENYASDIEAVDYIYQEY